MGKEQQQPKFRRAPPTVRREALVEATLACLRKWGHEGLSVRRIGAAAGVSPGLITHHFPSVSALIAASYETLSMSLLQLDRAARARRGRQSARAPAPLLRGLVRTRAARPWPLQHLARLLEHDLARSRGAGRARPHLCGLSGRSGIPPRPAAAERGSSLQAASGCDRPRRAARWTVDRGQHEPAQLPARRGRGALRGLDQCPVRGRLPEPADRAPVPDPPKAPAGACTRGSLPEPTRERGVASASPHPTRAEFATWPSPARLAAPSSACPHCPGAARPSASAVRLTSSPRSGAASMRRSFARLRPGAVPDASIPSRCSRPSCSASPPRAPWSRA